MSTAGNIAPGADEVRLESTVKDVEAVHKLHLEIHRRLEDRRFLHRRNLQFFQEIAERRGYIVGGYHRKRLIAYAAFVKPGEAKGGYAEPIRDIGLEPECVGESVGAATHPDFSGRGLHKRVMRRQFELANELGIKFIAYAVWPGNIASLRALLQVGCVIVGTIPDSDGANYLLLKSTATPLDIELNAGIRVDLDDREGNLKCLESGARIGCVDLTASPPVVVYVAIKDLSFPWAMRKGLG